MRPAALFTAFFALTTLGCASTQSPVSGCLRACPTGKSCVVGQCRGADEAPAPSDTRRVLLAPSDLAVIASSMLGAPGSPIPETLALGRAGDGTVELLFHFIANWRDDAEVVSAFLVLEPLEGVLPARAATTFETARIVEPWQSAEVSWGRQPRFDLPRVMSRVHAGAGAPVRIDVTALVRAWAQRSPDDHGIALIVEGGDPIGSAYAMGVSSGNGPRLEVYVR